MCKLGRGIPVGRSDENPQPRQWGGITLERSVASVGAYKGGGEDCRKDVRSLSTLRWLRGLKDRGPARKTHVEGRGAGDSSWWNFM